MLWLLDANSAANDPAQMAVMSPRSGAFVLPAPSDATAREIERGILMSATARPGFQLAFARAERFCIKRAS